MENEGKYKYWYLASPHMKDICYRLEELQEKYGENFHVISVQMNHQNYIALYKYWEEAREFEVPGVSESLNDSLKEISNDIDKLFEGATLVTKKNLHKLCNNPAGNMYRDGQLLDGFSENDILTMVEDGAVILYKEVKLGRKNDEKNVSTKNPGDQGD